MSEGRVAQRTRLALYASAATLLFLVERQLPSPAPWVRLGLANIVVLVVLLEEGLGAAAIVQGLRIVLSGFFAGSLFGPQFVLATSGALASLLVMAGAVFVAGRFFSPLGISLLGAASHAIAQLAAFALLFAGQVEVLQLLPVFLGLALVTGLLTGFVAEVLLTRLALARGA